MTTNNENGNGNQNTFSPFTAAQLQELNKPLDNSRIKHRQAGGNRDVPYLTGHDVIDTANRIFGHGAWGYDLLNVELVSVPNENGEVVGHYYAARVRVTVVNCVPITEEGVCAVQEGRNPRARIDAHDMARKGAITDALKRALRCFGDQYGNSLYDTDSRQNQASRNGNGGNNNRQPAPPASGQAQAQGQGKPAANPVPAPAPTVAAPPQPQNQPTGAAPRATEQQLLVINQRAARLQLKRSAFNQQLAKYYGEGVTLENITARDAADLLKRLAEAEAKATTKQPA